MNFNGNVWLFWWSFIQNIDYAIESLMLTIIFHPFKKKTVVSFVSWFYIQNHTINRKANVWNSRLNRSQTMSFNFWLIFSSTSKKTSIFEREKTVCHFDVRRVNQWTQQHFCFLVIKWILKITAIYKFSFDLNKQTV